MNKLWSEQNKTMQTQMKKKDTYEAGINTLFVEIRKRETQPRKRGEKPREILCDILTLQRFRSP